MINMANEHEDIQVRLSDFDKDRNRSTPEGVVYPGPIENWPFFCIDAAFSIIFNYCLQKNAHDRNK